MRYIIGTILSLTICVGMDAQVRTLRDRAAEVNGPINYIVNTPQWLAGDILYDLMLKEADLVVRSIVAGNAVPYLSEDDMDIGPITITQLGGTITLNGYEVTVSHKGLPRLKPGTDGLFFLVRAGDKYRIAGQYLGAFAIMQETIVPLTANRDFAEHHRGKSTGQFVAEILERLRAIRR